MKRVLLILLSIAALSSSVSAKKSKDFKDFGVNGTTYEIEEENLKDVFDKGLTKQKISEIRSKLQKDADNAFTSRVDLPFSDEYYTESYVDKVEAPMDIKDLNGFIYYKKGELIEASLPDGASYALCFIDAKHGDVATKEILKRMGRCDTVFVDNYHSQDFGKKYKVDAYPLAKQNLFYLKRFGVEFMPTKIHKIKSTITKTKYDIPEILKECSDVK